MDYKKDAKIAQELIKIANCRSKQSIKKYGIKYVTNNPYQDIVEELADIINYCKYIYVRLRKNGRI